MLAGHGSSSRLESVQLGFSVTFEDHEHRMFVGHHLPHWKDWDGGQIGGRPSWLQPRDLPINCLTCRNCEAPMSFLCQLYAPADEVNENAFHRSLYVFGCSSPQCATTPVGSIRVLRAQLPLRNPFYPEKGEEFEFDTADYDADHEEGEGGIIESGATWSQHIPETWEVQLCRVCGQRGKGKCPIQSYYFCGKHHQKEHKQFIFDKQQLSGGVVDFDFLPSVYAESELVVEDEPTDAAKKAAQVEKTENQSQESKKKGEDGKEKEAEKNGKDGNKNEDNQVDEEDSDAELEQDDLNEMTGTKMNSSSVTEDRTTMKFYDRINGEIKNVQEQCLRYLRWPNEELAMECQMPLWIRSDHQPPETIPECPYCGAERKFEFQLMPQMIHFLYKDHQAQLDRAAVRESITSPIAKKAVFTAANFIENAPPEAVPPILVDAKEKAVKTFQKRLMGETGTKKKHGNKELDWGVVAVFTCSASCGGLEVENGAELGAYREEYAWKQPSLDYTS